MMTAQIGILLVILISLIDPFESEGFQAYIMLVSIHYSSMITTHLISASVVHLSWSIGHQPAGWSSLTELPAGYMGYHTLTLIQMMTQQEIQSSPEYQTPRNSISMNSIMILKFGAKDLFKTD